MYLTIKNLRQAMTNIGTDLFVSCLLPRYFSEVELLSKLERKKMGTKKKARSLKAPFQTYCKRSLKSQFSHVEISKCWLFPIINGRYSIWSESWPNITFALSKIFVSFNLIASVMPVSYWKWASSRQNLSSGFLSKRDSSQSPQLQRLARISKFCL